MSGRIRARIPLKRSPLKQPVLLKNQLYSYLKPRSQTEDKRRAWVQFACNFTRLASRSLTDMEFSGSFYGLWLKGLEAADFEPKRTSRREGSERNPGRERGGCLPCEQRSGWKPRCGHWKGRR